MPCINTNYTTKNIETKIVHLGLGAFHRAHEAWATHELLEQGFSNWGICAISTRSDTTLIQQIEAQNQHYLLGIKDASHNEVHEVGSIAKCLHMQRDGLQAIIEQIASDHTAIVSITATEKGYYLNSATRRLETQHTDVQTDLQHPQRPTTVLAILLMALHHRFKAGKPGIALMSCDNIPQNSQALKGALLEFTQLFAEKHLNFIQPGFREWLQSSCSYPCCMVDRITPAVTEETLQDIKAVSGVYDTTAVSTEYFTQWVIEDNFPQGRPPWEKASGVSLVKDEEKVSFYEEMKLRMLNGAHSFLAYIGYLSAKEYIFECMEDTVLRKATLQLMTEEQLPSLSLKGVDFQTYALQLIERFSNPHLFHRCDQIAMDGSLKIPQRWLDGYRLMAGKIHYRLIPFGLAAWMQYIQGIDLSGKPIAVQDPNAEAIQTLLKTAEKGTEAKVLFSFPTTFGDLASDEQLIASVQKFYEQIQQKPILEALKEITTCV